MLKLIDLHQKVRAKIILTYILKYIYDFSMKDYRAKTMLPYFIFDKI